MSGPTDQGIGAAVITTQIGLTVKAFKFAFILALLSILLLPVLYLYICSYQDLDLIKINVIAHFARAEQLRPWFVRDAMGVAQQIGGISASGEVLDIMFPDEVLQAVALHNFAYNVLKTILLSSPFVGLGVGWLVLYSLGSVGRNAKKEKHLGGAMDLVSNSRLSQLVADKDYLSKIPFLTKIRASNNPFYQCAGVNIPTDMVALLALGTPGSGKSVLIKDLMKQVFLKNRKAVIYDHAGEFYKTYFRQGKDILFSPGLIGSVCWSVFADMKYTFDADSISHSFLPEKPTVGGGDGGFFEKAARVLFSTILERLAILGATNTSDIAKAFLEMTEEEMNRILEKSIASSAVGGDSKGQRQGVISSVAIFLKGLQAIGEGNWAINDWLESDGDARIFIVNTADTKDMFVPVYRMFINMIFKCIDAKAVESHKDKYWFFFDEIHQLGDIKIDSQLETTRKWGCRIVGGIQAKSQMDSNLGRDRAYTVMNCFNSLVILNTSDPTMAKDAAERIGRKEVRTTSQSQALAVEDWRDGAGLNTQEKEKLVVLTGHIIDLPSMMGFIKYKGFPATKIDFSDWKRSGIFSIPYVQTFLVVNEIPLRDPKHLIDKSSGPKSTEEVFEQIRNNSSSDPVSDASSLKLIKSGKVADILDAAYKDADLKLLPSAHETSPPLTQKLNDLGVWDQDQKI